MNEQETRHQQAEGMKSATDAMKEIVTRISDKPAAKVVFGEPIAEGGVTVIPVARVSYGVGGGGGQEHAGARGAVGGARDHVAADLGREGHPGVLVAPLGAHVQRVRRQQRRGLHHPSAHAIR